jgi:tRNA (mo5U34)-methyltransferase
VCDVGCANGYYMFRMLEHDPALVIGIDPNLSAWLQFEAVKRLARASSPSVSKLHYEFLRGENIDCYPRMYDIVFCLGVLYHTPDPLGMLKTIHDSLRPGGELIVDCQGIPHPEQMKGEEADELFPVALFPKKRYANMKGVYFLPTLQCLRNWLARANFPTAGTSLIFAEELTVEEQRVTEWAPVNGSLLESLDRADKSKTIEGYPAPHRFYLRCKREWNPEPVSRKNPKEKTRDAKKQAKERGLA